MNYFFSRASLVAAFCLHTATAAVGQDLPPPEHPDDAPHLRAIASTLDSPAPADWIREHLRALVAPSSRDRARLELMAHRQKAGVPAILLEEWILPADNGGAFDTVHAGLTPEDIMGLFVRTLRDPMREPSLGPPPPQAFLQLAYAQVGDAQAINAALEAYRGSPDGDQSLLALGALARRGDDDALIELLRRLPARLPLEDYDTASTSGRSLIRIVTLLARNDGSRILSSIDELLMSLDLTPWEADEVLDALAITLNERSPVIQQGRRLVVAARARASADGSCGDHGLPGEDGPESGPVQAALQRTASAPMPEAEWDRLYPYARAFERVRERFQRLASLRPEDEREAERRAEVFADLGEAVSLVRAIRTKEYQRHYLATTPALESKRRENEAELHGLKGRLTFLRDKIWTTADRWDWGPHRQAVMSVLHGFVEDDVFLMNADDYARRPAFRVYGSSQQI